MHRMKKPISESRLHELKEEAARSGRVNERGVRPAGAPFPVASPETGYYGIPLLKPPQWTWEIPVYFFVGGGAGAAALIAAVAQVRGGREELVRDAKYVAAAGGVITPILLISDLGKPQRFLNMLRVFKPQSAMSMGAWTVALFGGAATASAAAEMLRENLPKIVYDIVSGPATFAAAALGMVMASYTGVLIGATAIPAWNENVGTLPIHFAMSGVNTAVAVLELLGHDTASLNYLGIAAAAIESLEGGKIESEHLMATEPLKHGPSGRIVRAGGVLSGPVPLLLRALAAFSGSGRAKTLRRAAAASSIIGSVLTRVGWVYAGTYSARDYRVPLGLGEHASGAPEPAPESQHAAELASEGFEKPEHPFRMK
jgi:formate-dependent nitrite reductase membrane component NrfD